MDDTVKTVFDRIAIYINNQEFSARPIKFNYDGNGNAIEAIEFETVCSNCGALVQFNINNVNSYNNHKLVQCQICKLEPVAGLTVEEMDKKEVIEQNDNVRNAVKIVESARNIQQKAREAKKEALKRELISPWIDPIELGTYIVDKVEFA